eukprot:TRINITY_DN10792_c0_g1_i1.p2 TRINITY_DN10792_c0_g1~~TRINITY_DN10792_c0_g1_i1.p2  ORF type:complete len:110 (+),score=1.40 TRINITY_DN10792_c0_g1_i1:156-485(+)
MRLRNCLPDESLTTVHALHGCGTRCLPDDEAHISVGQVICCPLSVSRVDVIDAAGAKRLRKFFSPSFFDLKIRHAVCRIVATSESTAPTTCMPFFPSVWGSLLSRMASN